MEAADIARVVFLGELSLIALLALGLTLVRWKEVWRERRLAADREVLRRILHRLVAEETGQPARAIPLRLRDPELLVGELELLDRHLGGERWDRFKRELVGDLLLPLVRRWMRGHWSRRLWAARCLRLLASPRTLGEIDRLLHDPIPVIRFALLPAAIRIDAVDLVEPLLATAAGSAYARLLVADLMEDAAATIVEEVRRRYLVATDPGRRRVLLDLLRLAPSERADWLAALARDLTAGDGGLRAAAAAAVGQLPPAHRVGLLAPVLDDPEAVVRRTALEGLADPACHALAQRVARALDHGDWLVCTAAAACLARMGSAGRRMLEVQDPDLDHRAWLASQLVLDAEDAS